jgi:DNA modification methylase
MTPYYDHAGITIYTGDCRDVLAELPDESAHCVVTSPPYWGLRDYGVDGQLGLESTPEEYVATMTAVFEECRRVLRSDGTLWLNMGDGYSASPGQRKTTDIVGAKQLTNAGSNSVGSRSVSSLKPKDLIGMPWRLAFALQAAGWYLRSDIIWAKPNPMPESVTDRPTKAHEYLFLLAKSQRYYYDAEAIREPQSEMTLERLKGYKSGTYDGWAYGKAKDERGVAPSPGAHRIEENGRNRRSVWTVPTAPYPKAHFATFPPKLIESCILAGCPEGGVVLDPFLGSGTTAQVAKYNGRRCIGIELNEEYVKLALKRLPQDCLF